MDILQSEVEWCCDELPQPTQWPLSQETLEAGRQAAQNELRTFTPPFAGESCDHWGKLPFHLGEERKGEGRGEGDPEKGGGRLLPCMVEMCHFDLGDVEANLETKNSNKSVPRLPRKPQDRLLSIHCFVRAVISVSAWVFSCCFFTLLLQLFALWCKKPHLLQDTPLLCVGLWPAAPTLSHPHPHIHTHTHTHFSLLTCLCCGEHGTSVSWSKTRLFSLFDFFFFFCCCYLHSCTQGDTRIRPARRKLIEMVTPEFWQRRRANSTFQNVFWGFFLLIYLYFVVFTQPQWLTLWLHDCISRPATEIPAKARPGFTVTDWVLQVERPSEDTFSLCLPLSFPLSLSI